MVDREKRMLIGSSDHCAERMLRPRQANCNADCVSARIHGG
jgi:hypothetical protein